LPLPTRGSARRIKPGSGTGHRHIDIRSCRVWHLGELRRGRRWGQCLGMMTFTDLTSVPADHPAPFTDQLRLAVAAYLARFTVPPASTPNLTCAATCHGAPSAAWTHLPPAVRIWSHTSGGCRRSATSSPLPCRGAGRWRPGSARPASSTACWSAHLLTTCGGLRCPQSHPPFPLRVARLAEVRMHRWW
jgi:hypothetical protein